ncbi:hypothetical protein AZE42_08242 [Rhizopogon vesiculosus]|uniref:Uncharacterized protein n=1 Tax=Rhizopogon vesiculosus TaxID=180088 RepID=A0A1J8QVP5_9AGAM|nr:hypothetical protein AZE42_08242 [Rhizopogon vesiculosus]
MAPYQVNLFRQRTDEHAGQTTEVVGGAGASDIIRVGDKDNSSSRKRLISIEYAYTPTNDSPHHLSNWFASPCRHPYGSRPLYDIASHHLVRTISTHKGMSISHLATMLKPPDLIGHINLSLNLGSFSDAKDVISVRPVVPFHRMKDAKARDVHEVMMMLPVQVEISGGIPSAYDYPEDEFQRDYAFFVHPAANCASEASGARVAELEAEIQSLREQLGKAKGINDVMWETVVQKVMAQEKQTVVAEGRKGTTPAASTGEPMDEDDVERPRKKGKKMEVTK